MRRLQGSRFYVIAWSVLLCGTAPAARAQEIRLNDGTSLPAAHAQRVHLGLDSFSVTADKPDWIELRFQVDPGLHINSHEPHDELLVPTKLQFAPSGPKLVAEEYPDGVPLHLDVGTGETLSTYQGEFRVRLRVIAPKGGSSLTGTLRYQACDQHSCFPPRSLPVQLNITAR